MNRINELNDNCFDLASNLISELSNEFRNEIGDHPTIEELCQLLYWGIRSSSNSVSDINTENLIEIKAKVSKRKKIKLTPGDIVAVPVSLEQYHLLFYRGSFGHFGDAFQLIHGVFHLKALSSQWKPNFLKQHVFAGLEGVNSGKWKIIGAKPDLLVDFPKPPEYFHAKRFHLDNPQVGPFGSAESPTMEDGSGGQIRDLSKTECDELGLEQNDFFQTTLVEEVETFLLQKL